MKLVPALSALALAGGILATPVAAQLSGEVRVAGSSTVFPISTFVAEQFKAAYPGVEVPIAKIGTGGGFKEFSVGNTDASNASRQIKAKEAKKAKENGIKFVESLVAYDGLSIVINTENTWATKMTVEDLQKIFLADATAKSWKDVNPEFPDVPLKIYVPAETSGTYDYFSEVVADKGSLRGTSVGENDNLTVTGVADNKVAIGFLGYAYYVENKDSLTAVAIKNKAGDHVQPSSEAIETGSYNPFSRPLFVYWNVDSLDRTEVNTFAEFFLDVAPTAAEETGYVRLPSWVYDAMTKRLNDRITGSIYYTDSGEAKHGTLKELLDH
ncbi:MAG: PstS family phosphate ABC transporter substrate-binding protein [Planctomycetota bacterium]